MAENQSDNTQSTPAALPQPRLPEGHQPVNTSIIVRGAEMSQASTKVVRTDQHK
jgi:hypothetical protein